MSIEDGHGDSIQNGGTQDTGTQDNGGTQQSGGTGGRETLDSIIDRGIEETNGGPLTSAGTGTSGTQQSGTVQSGTVQSGTQQQGGNRQPAGSGTQQNNDTRQGAAAARQFGNLFATNARGDIVDARGKVVATRGYGRGVFHDLWPHIEHSTRESAMLKQTLKNYEDANKVAKDAGLSLDEQGAGLQLMVSWKKEPKKVLTTLLRLAQEKNIDVSDIVQGGAGLDPSAFRSMMDEVVTGHLKQFLPLVQDREQMQHDQQVRDDVQQQYDSFMEEFPDAKVHEGAIANVMRDKNISHREAYFAIRAFAAERRLDWAKPLAAQLQQQSDNGNGRGTPSGGGNNRQLPDMNGRGSNGDGTVQDGERREFTAADSWDKIARNVLAAHGRPVN